MDAAVRTVDGLDEGPQVEGGVEGLRAGAGLADEYVDYPFPGPARGVHTDGHARLDAGGNPDRKLAVGAAGLDRVVDLPHPRRHHLAALLDVVGVEVVRLVVELELEAVHVVPLQRLPDDCKALGAHLVVHEVEALRPGEAAVEAAPGADFQVLVVEAEIGRADIHAAHAAPLLHKQGRVYELAIRVGAVYEDLEGVVALVDELLRVLVGPAEHQVRPLVDVVAPELADLRVVEEGAAVAEAEHDRFDGGADQLVDARLVLDPLDGRLVHIDERVAPIVVEHELWLGHAGLQTRGLRQTRRVEGAVYDDLYVLDDEGAREVVRPALQGDLQGVSALAGTNAGEIELQPLPHVRSYAVCRAPGELLAGQGLAVEMERELVGEHDVLDVNAESNARDAVGFSLAVVGDVEGDRAADACVVSRYLDGEWDNRCREAPCSCSCGARRSACSPASPGLSRPAR